MKKNKLVRCPKHIIGWLFVRKEDIAITMPISLKQYYQDSRILKVCSSYSSQCFRCGKHIQEIQDYMDAHR